MGYYPRRSKNPMTIDDKGKKALPKARKDYNNEDIKAVQKNAKAKKILICGNGPDKYSARLSQHYEKLLDILPDSWVSKVNVIMEAKDPETLTMDKIMGNLKTYEMRKLQNQTNAPPRREVNLVLKATQNKTLVMKT
ncbi:hypothetical protein HAX54_018768 [Datura stramonium]|uniref:Uncharacterized protein n=1 Tax=Datura stramonium TaxID=4076 RepID=A0ABS8UQ71_DATST|nr:hypothetical protein [Datura stramonium]